MPWSQSTLERKRCSIRKRIMSRDICKPIACSDSCQRPSLTKTPRRPGSELSSSPSGPGTLRVQWVFSSTVYYFAHAQARKPEEWAGENYCSSSYLRLNLINLASYWVYLADFHSSCLKSPIKRLLTSQYITHKLFCERVKAHSIWPG